MLTKETKASLAIALTVSLYCSCMMTLFVQQYYGLSAAVQTVFSFFLFIALFLLLLRKNYTGRLAGRDLIFSAALAFTTILGVYIDHENAVATLNAGEWIVFFLYVSGAIPLFFICITFLHECAEKIGSAISKSHESFTGKQMIIYCFISSMIILLCWLPVWLAYYPGLWNYDPMQVYQVIDHSYNAWQPLIHTLILGGFYVLGLRAGNANLGVIGYDWFQMIFMAGVLGITASYFAWKLKNRRCGIVASVVFGLFPVNSILAISSTKDTIFSGLILLSSVLTLWYIDLKGKALSSHPVLKAVWILVIIGATVMALLFRNNAVYAWGAFLIVSFILMIRKKIRLRVFAGIAVCFVLGIGINQMMMDVLDSQKGDVCEALSVSCQQYGRIYTMAEMDEETIDIVDKYFKPDKITYNPHISDPMKSGLTWMTTEDAIDFVSDSMTLLRKYPRISIDSYLYLTEGYWYLNDISFSNIYGGDRQGYLLSDVKDGYGIEHRTKCGFIENLMETLFTANAYQKIPVLAVLFTPAFFVYAFLYLLCIVRGRQRLVFIPSFLLFLTLLMGPCCLVRYVYPIMLLVPLMLVTALDKRAKSAVSGRKKDCFVA